jgi:hypothetical protein
MKKNEALTGQIHCLIYSSFRMSLNREVRDVLEGWGDQHLL